MSISASADEPESPHLNRLDLQLTDKVWEQKVRDMEMRLARARRKKDRMNALYELGKLLARTQPEQAIEYLRQAAALARNVAEDDELGRMIALLGRLLHISGHDDESQKFLEESLAILERCEGTESSRAENLRHLAGIHLDRDDFTRTIVLLQSAIELGHNGPDLGGLSEAYSFLGYSFSELGDYDYAITMLEEAVELAQKVPDLDRIALAYNSIAGVQQNKEDYRGSLSTLHHALDITRSANSRRGEGITLGNIATAHIRLQEFELGLDYAKEALAIYEEFGWKANIAASYQDLGQCYTNMKQWDDGFSAFKKGMDVALQEGARGHVCGLQEAYGLALMEFGDLDGALAAHRYAEEIAEELKLHRNLWSIHYNYAKIYEKQRNFELAFHHMKLYAQIKERMNSQSAERRLTAMQIRMQMERTEKEKEIFRIKAEQLRQDMEQKNRELAAMALQQAQTAEMVTRLRKSIRSFEPQHGDIGKRLAGELLQHLGQAGNDTQWRSFEERFTPVHPDFARNLTECCPELTPTEMKVCTLLKVSMSTKEIAAILGTSVRTVEGHRRFIRKRLSLAPEQSLSMFLTTL